MKHMIYRMLALVLGIFAFSMVHAQSGVLAPSKPGTTVAPNKAVARPAGIPEHMPMMQNTGNPERDADAYREAKEKWIATYPKEYEDYKAAQARNAQPASFAPMAAPASPPQGNTPQK